MSLVPDKIITRGASVTRGCFVASIFLLIYNEKVFFDESFKTGADYGMILSLTLGCFLFMAILGTKLPTKILVGLLWGVLLATTVLWVRLAAALPIEPSNLGCSDPICGVPGQLALVTLELGIVPPLLLEHFRRSRQNLSSSTGVGAGIWAGLALLAAGLISLAGYYWTYLANVSLSILTGIGVVWMSSRIVPAQMKSEEGPKGASLYVGKFLRDFVVLAFVGVFGFSIMERDDYSFELLIPFGIGFIAFAVVLHYGTRLWGELPSMILLEGIVAGAVTLVLGFAIYVLFTNETAVLPVGLPPWLVGFAGAYLWHRMDLLAGGTSMRIGEKKRHFLEVPMPLIRKAVFFLFLTGLFLLTVINIDPDGTDSTLILDIGFVIGAIYFLIWITRLWNKKERATYPIATT